jgi:hypothetical protein
MISMAELYSRRGLQPFPVSFSESLDLLMTRRPLAGLIMEEKFDLPSFIRFVIRTLA